MPHTITHKPSKGNAAHGRHEIRALEDVGRTTGGIQYRSQTGAQAELALPTATDFTLGHDGTRPTWVSATQVATATQPVLSYLYTVTASASQILISWASVATQYNKIECSFFKLETATSALVAFRHSTDGISVDTATNRNFWLTNIARNRAVPASAVYGSTATNSASQSMLTGTDFSVMAGMGLSGDFVIWPSSFSGLHEPTSEWYLHWFSTFNANETLVHGVGAGHYWPAVDVLGVAIFPAPGAASFVGGEVRVYGRA